ncbi:MAG: flagellar biosynthesis repressor FlbT [Pseudomonadota bacterium]
MPLLIDIKPGDKVIINGAVIENAGNSTKLFVHNQAAILRGKEVLSEEDCGTPAARAYFALQCAYIFADKHADYLAKFDKLLDDYLAACPSAKAIGEQVRKEIKDDKLYRALKAAQKLIAHEGDILRSMQRKVSEVAASIPEGEDAGAPEGLPETPTPRR